jgi:NAD(P)-dependent dehydrogenase (short-subunit alcohol dehydrogenase family)
MARTLLITGASSGIGRATALLAGSAGYDVAVHFRANEAQALRVVEQLRGQRRRAIALQADLQQPEAVERLYAQLDRELPGELAGVINSAGIGLPRSPVTELAASALERLFAINVTGVMLSCREAVKRMSRARGGLGGVILNLSSMAATIGGRPGNAAYAASKAAVDAFTIGLAKEVAADGIRAISVRPGMVDTEMTREALADAQFSATVRASIPLGRPARADEVAKPLIWLLSDGASFITGTCVEISGGGFHLARA